MRRALSGVLLALALLLALGVAGAADASPLTTIHLLLLVLAGLLGWAGLRLDTQKEQTA